MKIGMLVNNLEVSGGYQKLVIRLAQQLQKLGHEVIVYTPKLDKKACYPQDLPSINTVTIARELANKTPAETYRHLAEKVANDLDALIIHDELSLLGIARLNLRLKQKVVWMLNNQLPENIKQYRPEVVSVYRQTVGPIKVKLRESKKAWERVKLIRKGLRRVNAFATYDDHNLKLVKKVLGRSAVNVAAGADLDRFKAFAKGRSFKRKKAYNILSVGVIFPHRRYEDLIRAVGILRQKRSDIHATIVGRQDLSPDYFASLQALVKELGVEKYVEFKNYVTDKQMVQLYKDSDAFVFINDGFTWGIAAFEAVAAKLPVIITDNIGAADLIKNGQSGWVVPPRDPSATAKAIEDILDGPEQAGHIVNTSYNKLTAIVSWRAYTERMLDLIQ